MENTTEQASPPKGPDDFMVSRLLGEDEDSTVVLARDASSDTEYAIKIVEKSHLEKANKAEQVEQEKNIFKLIKHPLFVSLHHQFNDEKRLYFVLTYASKGDLQQLINMSSTGIGLLATQFYAAELVLALEYMAGLNLIHRDLKPENILISEERHILVSDFGFVAQLSNKTEKVSSFVGTAAYVPPELLSEKYSCISSDLWSLGVIIFQMLTGKDAFVGSSDIETFTNVVNCNIKYPPEINPNGRRLIQQLLMRDPLERLGSERRGGFEKLKEDPFFIGIDWDTLPYKPAPDLKIPSRSSSRHTSSSSSLTDAEDRLSPMKSGTMRRRMDGSSTTPQNLAQSDPDDVEGYGLPPDMSSIEKSAWMERQASSTWHQFSENKLILKCAELEKKRGFSVKTRHFILLEGPRLIYVDPVSMEIKGEIPWTRELTAEVKTFKQFNINVPGRTYHLVDRKGNAMKWSRKINHLRSYYGYL